MSRSAALRGPVAKAVWREIRGIPDAKRTHPGLVELALTTADSLDEGLEAQLRMPAVKEIKLLLAEMRPKTPAALDKDAAPTKTEALLARLAEPL